MTIWRHLDPVGKHNYQLCSPHPVKSNHNTNEISEICHARRESVFITKNGYGDLVVMSIETYETMVETAETDTVIVEAEVEHEQDGQLFDARETMAALRRKHFG